MKEHMDTTVSRFVAAFLDTFDTVTFSKAYQQDTSFGVAFRFLNMDRPAVTASEIEPVVNVEQMAQYFVPHIIRFGLDPVIAAAVEATAALTSILANDRTRWDDETEAQAMSIISATNELSFEILNFEPEEAR